MSIRNTPLRRTATLLAIALVAGGCITSARVDEMGHKEAEKVAQQMGILSQAELERYVDAIGQKLAAASERPDAPWSFQIVDTPEPNAFALPGGYVYVSRGLLALVNSEDELAGVIGHEVGHVTAAHAEKRIRASIATSPLTIATGLAGFATSIVSPALGKVVATSGQVISAGLVVAPYGRAQENEADEIGQGLAARTGYDPAGISHFLHTLDREVTLLAGKEREPSFLDTHPMTADRVAQTEARSAALKRAPGRPIARGQADVFAKLEGIVVGEDPAQGVFQENDFLHPEFELFMEFPVGWETVNTATAVGALSPAKDALIALTLARSGSSLDAFVDELESEQEDLKMNRMRVNDLPAAHTRIADRDHLADVTLIELGGNVYSVLGQASGSNAKQYAETFEGTTLSFRPLLRKERNGIEESRLRVRKARSGETPAVLAKRTGSSWSAEQVSVANATETDAALQAGQPVKVGIAQAYTQRRH